MSSLGSLHASGMAASTATSSSGIRAGRKKRDPQCARCKNHGEKNSVKGHKNLCEFKFCDCDRCNAVADRQQKMALQIKDRRQRKADEKNREERLKALEEAGKLNLQQEVHPHDELFASFEAPDALEITIPFSKPKEDDNPPAVSEKEFQFIYEKVRTYKLDFKTMAPVILAILRQLKSEDEADREIASSIKQLRQLRQEARDLGFPFDEEEGGGDAADSSGNETYPLSLSSPTDFSALSQQPRYQPKPLAPAQTSSISKPSVGGSRDGLHGRSQGWTLSQ